MKLDLQRAFLLAAATSLLAACATTQSDAPKRTPIAVVGGQTVYEDEVFERIQPDLRKLKMDEYQLKQRALENFVLVRVITAEAKKRNLTVDQFLAQEVDAKAAEPTDVEIRAQYDMQQEKRKFEEVKDQYRGSLKQARVRAARQEYFQRLWDGSGITVLLRPPKTEVAADPARVRGNPTAPVMIVEFQDFQCPFCRRVQPALMQVLEKFPGQVALSFRDFPLREIHAEAQGAAEAARCAGEQGKFWEYHDLLFNEFKFDAATYGAHAAKAGLDTKRFDACLASGKYRDAIEADLQAGRSAGVDSTPGFFINGVYLGGAQPLSEFERVIKEELEALKRK